MNILGSPSYYTTLADYIKELIEQHRTILYTDFVKDVAPLAIALTERGLNCCSYHGKSMSSHDKVKAVDNWTSKSSTIQVYNA